MAMSVMLGRAAVVAVAAMLGRAAVVAMSAMLGRAAQEATLASQALPVEAREAALASARPVAAGWVADLAVHHP
ncbi:hypothetical protein EHH44_06095 [Mycolicibacter terrae]|uniref:Uncharacterized protein n=1 Tax=Mycolicibacter terrae TaxID=1788 RepID=A0ACD2EQJ7_9MYCO|nr:hypothetical protein EHH44_06095 [Mycolicibacter terrae]